MNDINRLPNFAKKAINDISNTPDISGMERNSINARDNMRDPVDLIRSVFDDIKAKNQSIKKDEFFGYCLYSRRILAQEFSTMYPTDHAFFKETLNVQGKNNHHPSAQFVEARFHIPEVTGLYPFPDWSIYKNIETLLRQASDAQQRDDQKKFNIVEKKLKEVNKKWYKELLKISLYPKMYLYTEDAEYIDWGRFCKVKFSKSFPSMSTGLVLDRLDDHINLDFLV